jgi:hypothetical protein
MIDMEALVAEYIVLRDTKKEKTEAFKIAMQEEIQSRMDAIEGEILDFMNKTNQKNAKTAYGTASRVEDVSATIADAAEFRHYVVGSEAWEMIDWRANKTAVKEIVEATGAPPPGVNFVRNYKIQVRKAS